VGERRGGRRRERIMTPFAEPLDVRDLSECFFYHTIDLPGVGVMHGEWDLRDGLDQYIGSVDVRGKRVLDVGSANGFVSFSLERNGATVVAYDLSPGEQWDLVPYGGIVDEAYARERQLLLRRLNNAFWFAHRALRSSARLAHGSVYAVAPSLGLFDVTIVGCILLHLRDPFLALQATLAQTTETAVVVDLLPPWYDSERAADGPQAIWFLPDPDRREPLETWWALSPEIVVRWLGVLGFGPAVVSLHRQPTPQGEATLFTVVAHRRQSLA
jgi:SAM-dependent methyltransferase